MAAQPTPNANENSPWSGRITRPNSSVSAASPNVIIQVHDVIDASMSNAPTRSTGRVIGGSTAARSVRVICTCSAGVMTTESSLSPIRRSWAAAVNDPHLGRAVADAGDLGDEHLEVGR